MSIGPVDLSDPALEDVDVTMLRQMIAKRNEYAARGFTQRVYACDRMITICWHALHGFPDTIPTGQAPL